MRCVEEVCVFYKQCPNYNPQGLIKLDKPKHGKKKARADFVYDATTLSNNYTQKYTNYPRQTLEFKCQRDGLHPTQKPVALFEYLIKTYTSEGNVILDSCMGSGTTAVACKNTNRNFIGFEIDEGYWKVACERI